MQAENRMEGKHRAKAEGPSTIPEGVSELGFADGV